ncbi:hypothetical protein E2C01_075324 [Portunus trituberculatus]|uniref:Uncharacterized protein n=1 Tax=Portunus trituberculatus TaxID=210409 RepID=A0A5B7IFK2_PORTR|nr:hypothetical protein [Portunus trituberculatus]
MTRERTRFMFAKEGHSLVERENFAGRGNDHLDEDSTRGYYLTPGPRPSAHLRVSWVGWLAGWLAEWMAGWLGGWLALERHPDGRTHAPAATSQPRTLLGEPCHKLRLIWTTPRKQGEDHPVCDDVMETSGARFMLPSSVHLLEYMHIVFLRSCISGVFPCHCVTASLSPAVSVMEARTPTTLNQASPHW